MERYNYATDSDSGTIEAASLQDAFDALASRITYDMMADGATLWVSDKDGNRIQLGE